MSTAVPEEFPASDTAPKYQVPSSITPLPHLPKRKLNKASGFGWASIGGFLVSGVTWAIGAGGGISATAKWAIDIVSRGGFAVALVFIVAAAVFFGMQVLAAMDKKTTAVQTLSERRDDRQTAILNEQSRILNEIVILLGDMRGILGRNNIVLTQNKDVLTQVLARVHEIDAEPARRRRTAGQG